MNIIKPACAAAALFALAACDQPRSSRMGTPGTGTPGGAMAPSAANPQGMAPGMATGGGVPTPTRPGGAGGVGSGNQPGLGGTGSGSGSR